MLKSALLACPQGVRFLSHLPALAALTALSLFSANFVQAEPNAGFDVNDVSVLFPLGPGYVPAPQISLADSELMPAALFQSVLAHAESDFQIRSPRSVSNYELADTWRIVGFRYDPCAPNDAHFGRPGAHCMEELRLVAQPLMRYQGPGDSAMHLLYTLGEGESRASSSALLALASIKSALSAKLAPKIVSAGKPLDINPYLQAAVSINAHDSVNEDAKLALKLYEKFVHDFAKSAQLSRITFMGQKLGDGTDWVFFGGLVQSGQWKVETVTNAQSKTSIEFDRTQFRTLNTQTRIDPVPQDPAMSAAQMFAVPSLEIKNNQRLNESQSLIVHRLENPNLSDRTNVDCLSCHLATSLRMSPSFGLQAFVPQVTAQIPARISAFIKPATTQSNPTLWNLHNFGYFNAQPSISQRTANESGQAAARLNQILSLSSPGLDCADVQEELLRCIDQSRNSNQGGPSFESCFRSCRP